MRRGFRFSIELLFRGRKVATALCCCAWQAMSQAQSGASLVFHTIMCAQAAKCGRPGAWQGQGYVVGAPHVSPPEHAGNTATTAHHTRMCCGSRWSVSLQFTPDGASAVAHVGATGEIGPLEKIQKLRQLRWQRMWRLDVTVSRSCHLVSQSPSCLRWLSML